MASAGAFKITVFLPLLLSGRNNKPRSMSTCSQRRLRISLRRQPVNVSSRSAAAANGLIFVNRLSLFGRCLALSLEQSTVHGMPVVSASRMALPSRSSSTAVRKRSRQLSLNFSIPRAGLVPSGTTPARAANAYMLPTTASTRLAWNGVSASDE